MGSARAVFIEGGPNSDGAYLKVTNGEMHVRGGAQTEQQQQKQDRMIALLEAILKELQRIK